MIDTASLYRELPPVDGVRLAVAAFADTDLDAIYTIERRAHAHPWKREHFVDSLQSRHQYCLGLRANGHWIGYAIVKCVAREAELLLFVIDQAWQGRRVGSLLLSYLSALVAAHADALFLEVRADNARAIRFYEAHNFNQIGIRPGYYHSGGQRQDALLYARTLDAPTEGAFPV